MMDRDRGLTNNFENDLPIFKVWGVPRPKEPFRGQKISLSGFGSQRASAVPELAGTDLYMY